MAEHKGAITLIVATLVLFGLFVFFGQNTIGPLLNDIGTGLKTMVTTVMPVGVAPTPGA